MSNSWWCYALYLPGSSVHGIFQQEYLDAISKLTQWSWFISKHTIQHHSNPNLCPNHWSWRSWGWPVLGRCIRPFRTNTKTTAKKRHFFHHRGLECKCRKWRDTWSNRQVCLWSTEWSRAKANRILLREHAGYSKCSFPTTQEMTLHMDITNGQQRKQTLYVLCGQRWRSSRHLAKAGPGPDCDSDPQLLIAKSRLRL